MALGKLLRKWRDKRGLKRTETITELEKLGVGMGYSYLAKLESGERSLAAASLEYREGLRQAYRISQEDWEAATGLHVPVKEPRNEIRLGEPTNLGRRSIFVYDLISAGPGSDGGTVIEEIDIPDDWRGEFVGYEVTGESMLPDIPNRAVVVIRRQDYATPGNEIVCWVPDHGMLIKVLDRVTEEGLYVLRSYNPAYKPIWTDDIIIYGVVVEIRLRRHVTNGNHGAN